MGKLLIVLMLLGLGLYFIMGDDSLPKGETYEVAKELDDR